jgi:pimeloyl-ACP methyl ester carboxylesterase
MNQFPQRPKTVVLSRVAKMLLLCGIALYLLICLLMGIYQRTFIYFPSVHSSQQVDEMAHRAGLERWTNSSGQFIGMKRLSARQPADGTVMIAYGNGSTAIGCEHYVRDIQGVAAFDVFVLEYPGYADRPGRPSERSFFGAADEAVQALPAKKPIYLVGESLGSGVASYLAGTYSNRIAGVLLISPFNSLVDAAQGHYPLLPVSLLLKDRFSSEKYLRSYHGKVGIVVDGKDTIVPEKLGRRLFDGYAGPKKLWEFPEGGHCEISGQASKFWKEVILFWQTNRADDDAGLSR